MMNKLNELMKNPNVVVKKHPTEHLYLTCYHKSVFYNGGWDEDSINSRGHVYDCFGNLVSNPMKKIFNLNEVEDSSFETMVKLLNSPDVEYSKLLHKSNGHLSILFHYSGKWYNTTKGSWDMEFIPLDREVIENHIDLSQLDKRYTYMFEIVADYDKHTLYDVEVDLYGDNVPVFLMARHTETGEITRNIPQIANLLVNEFDLPTTDDEWLELLKDVNTEGYVLHIHMKDGNDHFIKFKTEFYWAIRYANEMGSGNKFRSLFVSYFLNDEKAKEQLPEELHFVYDKVIMEYHKHKTSLEQVISCDYIGMDDSRVIYGIKQGEYFAPLEMQRRKQGHLKDSHWLKQDFTDRFDFSTLISIEEIANIKGDH